jgi:hypothetical protein
MTPEHACRHAICPRADSLDHSDRPRVVSHAASASGVFLATR